MCPQAALFSAGLRHIALCAHQSVLFFQANVCLQSQGLQGADLCVASGSGKDFISAVDIDLI